jgi:acyl-coenzyme A thioesterase PaaI-like protein
MPAGSNVLSVEFKMNLLRPAVGDRIVADARVVRAGRSVTVCMADVLALAGGESRQVALLTGTMMRVEDTARG